jgi:hypothetical protein
MPGMRSAHFSNAELKERGTGGVVGGMCFFISGIAIVLALMCAQRAARSVSTTAEPYALFRRVAYEDPALDLVREQARRD